MTETRQERIQSFAFIISELICAALAVSIVTSCFVWHNSTIAGREITLDEKINPNDAPAVSLARLPNIGLVRAEAIVAYRENFRERDNENQPFKDCNDLQKVKGIGPKTVKNMSKWLMFD
jgi:competence ComEA-like helix-hairpin-helix protein